MTIQNLAIVFGPNLIKPPHVTIESTLMIPKANSIFADVLTHLDQIMEMYEDDFHITLMAQQEEEVRGIDKLKKFCDLLMQQKTFPKIPEH